LSNATPGDTVKVHYTGKLESGEEFDSSRERDQPISFELGKAQVIPGFEQAVEGMAPGESKQVTIEPEQAYGDRRDDLVFTLPRDQFPGDIELQEGLRVTGTTQQGQQIEMTVVRFDDESVTLDANHPLAGQSLVFDIELVELDDGETSDQSA